VHHAPDSRFSEIAGNKSWHTLGTP